MPHQEQFETIYGGTDKYDYIDIEMERIQEKLDIVFNPKNKTPFWRKHISHISTEWRADYVSFEYDNSNIAKIDLHKLSVEYGNVLDKEVATTLFGQFGESIIKNKKNNITIKKEKKDYTWNQVEPWELDLYEYIDKTCPKPEM